MRDDRHRVRLGLCVVAAGVVLSACGSSETDDETGTPHAGEDAGADAPDRDASTDGGADADGATGDAKACTPPGASCASDGDCATPNKCIDARCVAPLADPSRPVTGVIRLALAPSLPPAGAECCGDFDGDGRIDNALAKAAAVHPLVRQQIEGYLERAARAGHFKYLVEVRDLPASRCGEVGVSMYRVDDDLDDDGLADRSLDEQLAGDATVRVRRASLRDDGYGALAQLNRATLDGSVVQLGPASIPFDFVMPDGTVLSGPIREAVVALDLGYAAIPLRGGERTDLQTLSEPPSETMTIGGYVLVSDVLAQMNEQASQCGCAGVDASRPFIGHALEHGKVAVECLQAVDPAAQHCAPSAIDACFQLDSLCTGAKQIPLFADISSGATDPDGNRAKDALSFGLYMKLVQANLAPAQVTPALLAKGDSHEQNDRLLVAKNRTGSLNVLANDFYDPSIASPIASVTQGDQGGSVSISPDGTYLVYQPSGSYLGEEKLTYTIADGLGATSTASVTVMVVGAVDPSDAGVDDAGADAGAGDASSDAGAEPDADAGALPSAHLYVSDRTAGAVSRFDVFNGTTAAVPAGSFASESATGMAFGPAGILYVGNATTGEITRLRDVATTPSALTALPSPLPDWSPSGLLFVPTTGGAGELWVACAWASDVLAVYPLDATGELASGATVITTATGLSEGSAGIQGLAFDAASSSLFVAADTVRRLSLTRSEDDLSLDPMMDPELTPLGAGKPMGLAMAPNRWLIGTFPDAPAISFAAWQVGDESSSLLTGAVGTNDSFNPLAVAILPAQSATPPVRVYTTTRQGQLVAVDVTTVGTPSIDNFVCEAPASWIVAGE